jgi:hypothetical protein
MVAVNEERLEAHRPTTTALPLGKGEGAVGATWMGRKSREPSVAATGSD